MRDPYEVLGVAKTRQRGRDQKGLPGAGQETSSRHPGRRYGRTRNAFRRSARAYDIVGDKEKRTKFDRGEIDANGNPRGFDPAPGLRGSPFGRRRRPHAIFISPGSDGDAARRRLRAEDIFADILAAVAAGGAGARRARARTSRSPSPSASRRLPAAARGAISAARRARSGRAHSGGRPRWPADPAQGPGRPGRKADPRATSCSPSR